MVAGRIHVLLIEDDADSREVFAEVLSEEFEVSVASTGEQGLEMFRLTRPDVVITDQSLPGLRGTEVARQVKSIAPEARVVLVSGHGKIEGSDVCDAVIGKPFDVDALSHAIHALSGEGP
jgi:DNA-binding response OmpR family regulator